MIGYIYCHKNKINGRVYIGQTSKKPETRWGKNGVNYCGQSAFYREILRYGWDNFDHIILSVIDESTKKALTERLNELEISYIREYNSMDPSKGYNTVVKDTSSYIRLTVPAKRTISRLMAEGKTFEESYKIYKDNKH